jgi:hypothetical protein
MQGFGADPEILNKLAIGLRLLSLAGTVVDAQQVGCMDGHKHGVACRRKMLSQILAKCV